MVWDVLDWMENEWIILEKPYKNVVIKWEKKRFSIDEQSTECIKYISDLIPNN
jgi:hypothetical protein